MGRGGAPALGRPMSAAGTACGLPNVSGLLNCLARTATEWTPVQVFGQLVPLGYAVACPTPAAYRRRRLRRPSWKSNLGVGFALRRVQRIGRAAGRDRASL